MNKIGEVNTTLLEKLDQQEDMLETSLVPIGAIVAWLPGQFFKCFYQGP